MSVNKYKQEVIMYTDGGSRGNPGPSAIGIWVESLDIQIGEYIGEGTNNEAEYQAIITGLKKIKSVIGKKQSSDIHIVCRMDSELAVKQLNHQYKIKDERMQKKFIEVWNLCIDFGKVEFQHVPREENKQADLFVNQALDGRLF